MAYLIASLNIVIISKESTLFKLIDSEFTGVDFENTITETEDFNRVVFKGLPSGFV